MHLYKKLTLAVLLNNLIITTFLISQKLIFFLNFDIYKYFFFNFSKTTNVLNNRIIAIKYKIKN